MNLADVLALAFVLLVGGYIFAVGVMPQIFHWLGVRMGLLHPHQDTPSRPTLG